MKQFYLKTLLLCLFMLAGLTAHAYNAQIDGIYYNFNETEKTAAVTYYSNSSSQNKTAYSGAVVIPSTVTYGGTTYSVTSIGSYAFQNCSGLTSITIPESVTHIGMYAFSGCSGLTSITIPNSVTYIGNYAFYNCSGLTSITIPESVTYIGDYAFSGTKWINDLPDGLVYVGKVAFKYKGTMPENTTIVIKEGTTSISAYAFYDDSGLTSITIPSSVTSIGHMAFEGCSGLTSITIPESVTSIGSSAFSNCSSLTSVTIGNSVTKIGQYAFRGCSGLTSITIPNSVTSIGDYAFSSCSGLTSITIGNSVTSIGGSAFCNCSGLTSITIPNSVTSIGSSAFSNCSSLTSITIPESVTYIGDEAFSGCSGLTSITIPNSVTYIGSGAFEGCSGLTSITIPNSVTYIRNSAFEDCSGLTSITIPESVTIIDMYAFLGCSGLTSITIPNSVTIIGDYAFEGCNNLRSILLSDNLTSIGLNSFKKTVERNKTSDPKLYVTPKAFVTLQTLWAKNGKIYNSGQNADDSYQSWNTYVFDITTGKQIPKYGVTASPTTIQFSKFESNKAEIIEQEFYFNKEKMTEGLTGLDPYSEQSLSYTAKYAIYGNTFTINETFKVTTLPLTLNTLQPKVATPGNVIVAAESNLDDAETNVGFEWRRTDWTDDFSSNTGGAFLYEGNMEGYIRNLNTDKLWKYRPYYESNSGKRYYGEWMGLDPTNTSFFEPTVHTYANVSVQGNQAEVKGYAMRGSDNVASQGFFYWQQPAGARAEAPGSVSVPKNAMKAEANGNIMTTTLEGLDYLTTYCYVAFMTTSEGDTFYGELRTFETGEDTSGIEDILSATKTAAGTQKVYDLNGRRIAQPRRGLNIIRTADGRTVKVMKK